MSEVSSFALLTLVAGIGFALALLASKLTERVPVPAPGLFLVGAVLAANYLPGLAGAVSFQAVERVAVVALVLILFHGGMSVGGRRFGASAAPIVTLGLAGTFATPRSSPRWRTWSSPSAGWRQGCSGRRSRLPTRR